MDIHSFIPSKIGDYIELRKEECYQHILTFEKDINESGFSGASRKKKAQAGIKLYNTIEESLEGLRELGQTLAQEMPKTKPDYTKILSTQMKDGGKLSATHLRELVRMFDGTALTNNVRMDEMMDIISTSMMRLHPSSCVYCLKEDLTLVTRHEDPRLSCDVCRRSLCEACQTTDISEVEKDDVTVVRVCSTCKTCVIESMRRFNTDLQFTRQNSKPAVLTRWKNYQSGLTDIPLAPMDFSGKNPSNKASQPNLNRIEEEEEEEEEVTELGEDDISTNRNEADDIPADLGGDPTEDPPKGHEDPLRRDIKSLIEILTAKEARSLARRKKKASKLTRGFGLLDTDRDTDDMSSGSSGSDESSDEEEEETKKKSKKNKKRKLT